MAEEPMDTRKNRWATRFMKRKYVYIYFIVALLVIVIAGYFFFRGKFKSSDYLSSQMRQMQQVVSKVRSLESEIQSNQNEIFSLMKEYKDKTGKELPAVNMLNLTEEEKVILEKKIREEQDVSIKSLLEDILEKNNEINELKERVRELEELLPKPHIVQRGENHYQIAMDFLLKEKGVEKDKALKLIERALLFDPMIAGFKVWNFYSGEEYGTFVTQGDAPISPNEVRRRAKKTLVDARDKAIAERDKLAEDIDLLENRRGQLISQLELLNDEKQKLIFQISDLNKENIEMQETINSLFYLLDLKKNLKQKGIIKGGFLRSLKLKKVDPELFKDSIDLRSQNSIQITASDFNIRRIKRLFLYPRYYRYGIDYRITISADKQEAELIILDTVKLKNERVVISVE